MCSISGQSRSIRAVRTCQLELDATLSGGCVMPNRSAALVKCRSSATAKKNLDTLDALVHCILEDVPAHLLGMTPA
jgi:hypothetical protein